jgi:16S rRNA (uracil1498-N3)-methyltransferase
MPLPFFYKENIALTASTITLDEYTSKHIVQVLRMKVGEQLQLTDGNGSLFTCEITDNNRKRCTLTNIQSVQLISQKSKVKIAISLLKNTSRFEWFLEKATEIGVAEIVPLICERTEKTAFKFERMQSIVVSAMLQSQQTFLPLLHQPQPFNHLAAKQFDNCTKFIAHCEDENNKQPLNAKLLNLSTPKLILIGPEGDFTPAEIELALKNNFVPVSLGNTRLRTETAGMVAATLLNTR